MEIIQHTCWKTRSFKTETLSAALLIQRIQAAHPTEHQVCPNVSVDLLEMKNIDRPMHSVGIFGWSTTRHEKVVDYGFIVLIGF